MLNQQAKTSPKPLMPSHPIEPQDAEYPQVPTPKELELSRQLVALQQEKDQRETKSLTQIRDLEAQVHKLQVRVHNLSELLQSTKRDQILAQQAAVEEERHRWKVKLDALQVELDQERNDKEAQKHWQCKFLAPAATTASSDNDTAVPDNHHVPLVPEDAIDPTEDVFSRFAQSVALLPASQAPQVALAGVLPFLTHLLDRELSDVVTGSVLLALVHLAIHERTPRPRRAGSGPGSGLDVREQIMKTGVATPLSRILEHSTNPRVVVEASRLCAALGGHIPNKRVLASKNIVRFLIQHLMPRVPALNREKRIDEDEDDDDDISAKLEKLPLPGGADVQQYVLSALVNLSHDSEILRSQIASSLHFLPIVVRYVREGVSAAVQAEAAKLLGNVAYNHVVNQSTLMAAEAPAVLASCLTADSLQRSSTLVRAGAVGLANLAYTSVNQLAIGYSGATTLLLQLLVDAVSIPAVVEAAATALTCLCHQNPPNKARVAAQNGLQVLLYALGACPKEEEDQRGVGGALVAVCECLAVVAYTRPNRQQVMELDGHLLLCQVCKQCSIDSPKLLEASARAICALVPPPRERLALLSDDRESKLETRSIGLKSLERARHLLSEHTQRQKQGDEEEVMRGHRRWLTQAIDTLTRYRTSAKSRRPSVMGLLEDFDDAEQTLTEFRERSGFSLESLTAIPPDELCPGFYDD